MMQHLTDDQMQDYLEGNPSDNQAEIIVHLASCRECRMAVVQYQTLFQGLKNDTGFELSPGFAVSVTRRVAPEAPKSSPVPEYLLIGAAVAAAACAIYFLVDLSSIFDLFKGGFARRTALENAVTSTVTGVLDLLNIKSNMLLLSGGALLTLGILDGVVKSLKRGRLYFFA